MISTRAIILATLGVALVFFLNWMENDITTLVNTTYQKAIVEHQQELTGGGRYGSSTHRYLRVKLDDGRITT